MRVHAARAADLPGHRAHLVAAAGDEEIVQGAAVALHFLVRAGAVFRSGDAGEGGGVFEGDNEEVGGEGESGECGWGGEGTFGDG